MTIASVRIATVGRIGHYTAGGRVTGLEGVALTSGSRMLGGVAASSAQALLRKASFRWRVWWRVRRRVDFHCRWRIYRKWLKSISVEELSNPVESICVALANRLDNALSTASDDWASSSGHFSRALRLVDLTFPAIAAESGDGDRAEIAELWARHRQKNVSDELLKLVGPNAALSSEDLSRVLLIRSKTRRAVRLQAFGLCETLISSQLGGRVLDVAIGKIMVLEGDFGSGKSETAEAWHRSGIKNLLENGDAPFPVWLDARGLHRQSVESALDEQIGRIWRDGRGAAVVIDGLDETDPATAQALLDSSRFLAGSYANVCVLLTSRPGILSPTEDEKSTVPPLTESASLELINLVSGKSHSQWRWTSELRATATRPFFALAAGVILAQNDALQGEAQLIRALVEDALKKGTERSAITGGETRQVLQKLAVSLTRMRQHGLTFSESQVARSSRLVADGPNNSVYFSLPIFQQWFAAQSLLEGNVLPAEVVNNAVGFYRWRWSAAIAALSAPDNEMVDNLLGAWVTGNPGAASWVLNEAFRGQRVWRTDVDEDLDPGNSGDRLLTSLRTWSDSMGTLADGLLPAQLRRGPVQLGVAVSNHRISAAISTASPPADTVTELPPDVRPVNPLTGHEWRLWISGAAPEGHAWPWIMVRNIIAGNMIQKLSDDPGLGSVDGVWIQERRFELARRLLRKGSFSHSPLPSVAVREAATKALDFTGKHKGVRIEFNGSAQYSIPEIEDLITWIDTERNDLILSYLPEYDIPHPPNGFVWNFYSPRRLMEFEVEAYGRACEAYDEAISHSFSKLGWAMPDSAIAPFGTLIEIQYDSNETLGNVPGLTVIRVPMDLMSEFTSGWSDAIWSSSGRAVITDSHDTDKQRERQRAIAVKVRSWLAKGNLEQAGGVGWVHTLADDMATIRPACSLAAQWISDDLKRIGIASGTFPQLK